MCTKPFPTVLALWTVKDFQRSRLCLCFSKIISHLVTLGEMDWNVSLPEATTLTTETWPSKSQAGLPTCVHKYKWIESCFLGEQKMPCTSHPPCVCVYTLESEVVMQEAVTTLDVWALRLTTFDFGALESLTYWTRKFQLCPLTYVTQVFFTQAFGVHSHRTYAFPEWVLFYNISLSDQPHCDSSWTSVLAPVVFILGVPGLLLPTFLTSEGCRTPVHALKRNRIFETTLSTVI